MGVVICAPGDPEAKGLVERANGYLETSFVPGRRFSSPGDFNAQLGMGLRRANNRVHSTLRCRPTERLRATWVARSCCAEVAVVPRRIEHQPAPV